MKYSPYLSLLLFSAAAIVLPSPTLAQVLTSRDSTEIRAVAVMATLDTFKIKPDGTRVWLELDNRNEVAPEAGRLLFDQVAPKIRTRFTGLRLAPRRSELFLCPPGVRLFIPATGCPILDNGLIVTVGRIVSSGGEVSVSISVTQSKGSMTWAAGHVLFLTPDGESWRLARVGDRFIT